MNTEALLLALCFSTSKFL